MLRLIVLILFSLLLPPAVSARGPQDFSLNISVTRGERSRDSHSQTTRITLNGRELVYEKSYRGARGKTAPVRKSFKITDEDIEKLKKVIRDNDLLKSDRLAVVGAESGIRRYFEIAIGISLDGRKSSIEIGGPRDAAEIKEERIYRRANQLLDAVYTLLSAQDKEIGYENRDLIQDAGAGR